MHIAPYWPYSSSLWCTVKIQMRSSYPSIGMNWPNHISLHTFCYLFLSPLFHLLHLLSQSWVLHTSSHHSEEERGEDGPEVESDPGDGVGQQNLFPLPVHRLHNLIGQDWRAHTMGQMAGDNWGGDILKGEMCVHSHTTWSVSMGTCHACTMSCLHNVTFNTRIGVSGTLVCMLLNIHRFSPQPQPTAKTDVHSMECMESRMQSLPSVCFCVSLCNRCTIYVCHTIL